ncbi:MAG: 5-formyltetrahydrofolate cyclo-ligase [Proteobacteria bacterium]|nr:MAG: 5-formyltetrahydrofolate cyclo-ligase [Pseudomonadota bacterium]
MTLTGKAELRREMRARRRSVGAIAQRRAAADLANRLVRLRLFGPDRRVAFYLARDGEIDPAPAMRAAVGSGAVCLLPVVPRRGGRPLRFASYDGSSRMVPNRFGIPEPSVPASELLTALEVDCICLPLVAFDSDGNRLGMGGGFYDATLALRAARRRFRRPLVVGLAHECQRVARIEAASWDVPVDRIVTDCSIYQF